MKISTSDMKLLSHLRIYDDFFKPYQIIEKIDRLLLNAAIGVLLPSSIERAAKH